MDGGSRHARTLVELEVFNKVEQIIGEKRGNRAEPRERQKYPLTRLAKCGKCGGPMCGKTSRKEGSICRYYVCSRSGHRGKAYCPGISVDADRLEEVVLAKLRQLAEEGERATPVWKEQRPADCQTEEGRAGRKALDRLKCRMAKLFELYELGEIGKDEFEGRIAKMKAERERLQDASASKAQRSVPGQASQGADRGAAAGDPVGPFRRAGVREVVVRETIAELMPLDATGQANVPISVSLAPHCDTSTSGGKLKHWRLSAGLHQKDVAEMLGVHVQSVRNWEKGRCQPSQTAADRAQRLTFSTVGAGKTSRGRLAPKNDALLWLVL